ncbi:hypothetical protein H0H87_009582 [Tephrocybe sp. NHM501043]|nr:hypothetical protein H0H87_009582 [Tephrocybe sp. NHM501043]
MRQQPIPLIPPPRPDGQHSPLGLEYLPHPAPAENMPGDRFVYGSEHPHDDHEQDDYKRRMRDRIHQHEDLDLGPLIGAKRGKDDGLMVTIIRQETYL